jgi:hypothetical protein
LSLFQAEFSWQKVTFRPCNLCLFIQTPHCCTCAMLDLSLLCWRTGSPHCSNQPGKGWTLEQDCSILRWKCVAKHPQLPQPSDNGKQFAAPHMRRLNWDVNWPSKCEFACAGFARLATCTPHMNAGNMQETLQIRSIRFIEAAMASWILHLSSSTTFACMHACCSCCMESASALLALGFAGAAAQPAVVLVPAKGGGTKGRASIGEW